MHNWSQMIQAEADPRSVATSTVDPAALRQLTRQWIVPSETPEVVVKLWDRAVAQFCSAPLAYENVTGAVRTGFEAAEEAVRAHLGDLVAPESKPTFGTLIHLADDHDMLTPNQAEWLKEYALCFRNRLTHANGQDPLVLSPAMGAEMLEGIARFLTDLKSN